MNDWSRGFVFCQLKILDPLSQNILNAKCEISQLNLKKNDSDCFHFH